MFRTKNFIFSSLLLMLIAIVASNELAPAVAGVGDCQNGKFPLVGNPAKFCDNKNFCSNLNLNDCQQLGVNGYTDPKTGIVYSGAELVNKIKTGSCARRPLYGNFSPWCRTCSTSVVCAEWKFTDLSGVNPQTGVYECYAGNNRGWESTQGTCK